MADASAIQMAAESRLRQSRKAVEPSESPRKAVEPSESPRKAVEPSEPLSPVVGEPAPSPERAFGSIYSVLDVNMAGDTAGGTQQALP